MEGKFKVQRIRSWRLTSMVEIHFIFIWDSLFNELLLTMILPSLLNIYKGAYEISSDYLLGLPTKTLQGIEQIHMNLLFHSKSILWLLIFFFHRIFEEEIKSFDFHYIKIPNYCILHVWYLKTYY